MYIKITMAMTSDGKTADIKGRWYPLCRYERERFHKSLSWADAVVVGERTVRNSNISFLPPGTERGSAPVRIVLDRDLSLNPDYRVFDTRRGDTVIVASCRAVRAGSGRKSLFEEKKVRLACIDTEDPFKPEEIVEMLRDMDVERVLIVGGGETNWTFMKEGFFDEYQVTITPYLLGGSPYTPTSRYGKEFPGIKIVLEKVEICPCGEEVVLYYRNPSRRP